MGPCQLRGVEKFPELHHAPAAAGEDVTPIGRDLASGSSRGHRVMTEHEDLVAVAVEFLRREFGKFDQLGDGLKEVLHGGNAFARPECGKIFRPADRVPLDFGRQHRKNGSDVAARIRAVSALDESYVRFAHSFPPMPLGAKAKTESASGSSCGDFTGNRFPPRALSK